MRKFDLIPKVADESFDVRTKSGGLISIATLGFMALIIFVEIQSYLKSGFRQEAFLPNANNNNQPLDIYFNITFGYPCQLIHINLLDLSSLHPMQFTKSIQRQRLDPSFKPLGPLLDDNSPQSIMYPCGGCLGSNYSKCCLTCMDIAASFKLENKLVPNLKNVEQCDRDYASIKNGETCMIIGQIESEMPQGALIFEAGGSTRMPVHYKHDLTYFGDNVNLSHWIRTLRFGREFKGMENPLDNARWSQRGRGFFQYHYHLNLVETIAEDIRTHQYSATFDDREITKTVSKKHPSITFEYKTTPVSVRVVSTKKSFASFLTNLCAIIGGGFTIGGLLDSFWFKVNTKRD